MLVLLFEILRGKPGDTTVLISLFVSGWSKGDSLILFLHPSLEKRAPESGSCEKRL